MADIKQKLRKTWMKGMETIGTTASGIASNARYKVDEMNLLSRRREVLAEMAAAVLELHKQNVSFPEQIETMLQEIDAIDDTVRTMRADYINSVTPAGMKVEQEAENDETAAEPGKPE